MMRYRIFQMFFASNMANIIHSEAVDCWQHFVDDDVGFRTFYN